MIHRTMTDEGPSLDSFLRHLQTEVESANEIADKSERNGRLLQLEASIQEAIIFANRTKNCRAKDSIHFCLLIQRFRETVLLLQQPKVRPFCSERQLVQVVATCWTMIWTSVRLVVLKSSYSSSCSQRATVSTIIGSSSPTR